MGVDSSQRKRRGAKAAAGARCPPCCSPGTPLVVRGLRCAVLAPAFGARIPWCTWVSVTAP